jgi:hypothetical protein
MWKVSVVKLRSVLLMTATYFFISFISLVLGLPTALANSGMWQGHLGSTSIAGSMKRTGVKKALVLVEFDWFRHPTALKVARILYFEAYDEDCSQILEPEKLQALKEAGLEKQLVESAMKRTAESKMSCFVEHCAEGTHGVSRVEFRDDDSGMPNAILTPVERLPVSPRGVAPYFGDAVSVKAFLESRDITPQERNQGLIRAVWRSDNSCILDLFLDAGSDVDAEDENGLSPLGVAATYGRLHDLKKLLDAGANLDIRDQAGDTPLISAARTGQTGAVKMLLDAGADPSIRSRSGETALGEAIKSEHFAAADLIKRAQKIQTR